MPKYPDIKVKLIGTDGNAFALLARVNGALKKAGVPEEEFEVFFKEATSGDYNHLLCTCMDWVTVE